MAIRVTCPGCLKRFQVSDQFAGKTGPCPKCKKEITIPAATEEVKIHGADRGPKDSKGEAVLKPVFRQETRITVPAMIAIALTIIGSLVAAFVLRLQYPQGEGLDPFPWLPLIIGAILVAFPLAMAGYATLRDDDLKPYEGSGLWMRIAICAVCYALLWLAFPAAALAFREYNLTVSIVASALFLGLGGLIALGTFDFEYLMGVVHCGFYFGICILLRWIACGSPFPIEA